MNILTEPQRLLASIKELLTINNLTKLDFGDPDDQTEPVNVIWYDKHSYPYDDPVLKVFLDSDGLSLEIDAREFGNTVRLYEDDFAHNINWLVGIRDNVIETLKNKALIVIDQQIRLAGDLADRERQWQKDVKAFLIDTLRKHGGRISFIPKNAGDEYPVTATLYGQHDFPRIDISAVYLSGDGEHIMVDGFETEEGQREKRCGFGIEPEHLSDIFRFVKIALNL